MMKKENIKWLWSLLKDSFKELTGNDPLRLTSSTAFFAMFAIIAIIILLLNLFGTVISERLLKEEMLKTLQVMLGSDTTQYLSGILENVQNMQKGFFLTLGIIIFLLFVATTLFQVVHNSLNQIWHVKPKKDANFRVVIRNRFLSLLIIFFGGILFLGTFFFQLFIDFLGQQFFQSTEVNVGLVEVANVIFSFVVLTIWLAVAYKYLPDVRLPWKPVWFGSFITAIFFLIGQFLIGKVILAGNLSTIYGASASMVLLLLFIFYCSCILYYGFCLVKKYTEMEGYQIESTELAVKYEINELE
jgi:membrane protein